MKTDVTAPHGRRRNGRFKRFYREEFVQRAYKLALLGVTLEEMGEHFGVRVDTIKAWRKKYPAFGEAVIAGGILADAEVATRLYQRATGYQRPATKVFMPQGAPEPVFAEYTEHMAPDVHAASLWLRNRQYAKWRERVEHTGPDGEPLLQMGDDQRLAWAASVLSRIRSLEPPTIEHEPATTRQKDARGDADAS